MDLLDFVSTSAGHGWPESAPCMAEINLTPRASARPVFRMARNPMGNLTPQTRESFGVVGAMLVASGLLAPLSMAAVPQGSVETGVQSNDTHSATSAATDQSDEQKPWLITPTLSADPKLGTNIGGVVAYLKQLDADSTPSMVGLSFSYSDTDSVAGGIGAQLFWGADTQRLMLFLGGAEINNEYDDFLGTGQSAETQDSVHAVGFRYLHQLGDSDWLAGFQGLSTNYAVGADGYIDGLLTIIGLSGFDATGLGLVLQHDTMDHQRDPTDGHLLTLHNMAYREGLGGETSFDVIYSDLRWYRTLEGLSIGQTDRPTVVALQAKGRFTEDAPLSGFSSVSLPGYTMGNYLSEDYAHLLLEGRLPISRRFGIVAFGGIGCQFGTDIAGTDINCADNTYPSAGLGLSYLLDEAASILIRMELAKGKNDNEAIYLRFGHSF